MSFEPRQGIVLFANERQNERQPVMRGVITVTDMMEPGEYEVSLWGKVSKKGSKFWSGEFKPKQERVAVKSAPATGPSGDEFNDEIPF